ncbi:iron-sulfur cluster assembly scaffold protein [Cupriavidus lacunae]|uniref:NIF system FeS cluster assembly NifU N-terminal domain-containing protein n=1 Tax=Cupriavidus lacunae TaxID=2666307 RepID=A0A370NMK9_9BURK|nr:hypothetical protein DN412_29150 [Cupriavidus lacunae]
MGASGSLWACITLFQKFRNSWIRCAKSWRCSVIKNASSVLFQRTILDHARKPRGFGELEAPTLLGSGVNELCGDEVRISAEIRGEVVAQLRCVSVGCLLCRASASMMCEWVPARTLSECYIGEKRLRALVAGLTETCAPLPTQFLAFKDLRALPQREKCALLPWSTLIKALEDYNIISRLPRPARQ